MVLTVTGITELRAALEAMGARVETATPVAVAAAAAMFEARARDTLSRYSHERGTPTPSPPGDPPAKITGTLADSWDLLGPTPAGAAAWMATLGPTAPYARIQELGGTAGHGSELPARPYLHPTYEETAHSPEMRDVFVQAWGRAITG